MKKKQLTESEKSIVDSTDGYMEESKYSRANQQFDRTAFVEVVLILISLGLILMLTCMDVIKTMITDEKAKEILCRMLPGKIHYDTTFERHYWIVSQDSEKISVKWPEIQDTEWQHIAWLAEDTLTPDKWEKYSNLLMVALRDSDASLKGSNISARYKTPHATWQQRAEAMGKVRGWV